MQEADVLELAVQLRDLTLAQLEAVRAARWEDASAYLQQRGVLLERLQEIDPLQLSRAARDAIAAVLDEVQELDRELVTVVEQALEQTRGEQRALERNEAAAQSYRRALGTSDEAGLIDEEA
uniref:Flagellar protein FliT n=1 Tax=Thermomicrobium roseum TaxID=500 RepID=A0A7C5VUF0_THERO